MRNNDSTGLADLAHARLFKMAANTSLIDLTLDSDVSLLSDDGSLNSDDDSAESLVVLSSSDEDSGQEKR